MNTTETPAPMDGDSFQDLLDRQGCELAEWPADERQRAELLLADSAAARQQLQSARQLALLLDDALEMSDSRSERALADRIEAQLDVRGHLLGRLFEFVWPASTPGRLLRPAALAVLPLLAGFVAGASSAGSGGDELELWTQGAFVASAELETGGLVTP